MTSSTSNILNFIDFFPNTSTQPIEVEKEKGYKKNNYTNAEKEIINSAYSFLKTLEKTPTSFPMKKKIKELLKGNFNSNYPNLTKDIPPTTIDSWIKRGKQNGLPYSKDSKNSSKKRKNGQKKPISEITPTKAMQQHNQQLPPVRDLFESADRLNQRNSKQTIETVLKKWGPEF